MISVDFSSLRMVSLKSFCAPRQTLGGALQGYVCVPSLGLGCITPPCVYFSSFHIDNLSRHFYKFPKIFTYDSIIYFYAQYSNLLVQFKIKCSHTEKREWASLRRADRPCGQSLGLQKRSFLGFLRSDSEGLELWS
jgi:hypothetical protein